MFVLCFLTVVPNVDSASPCDALYGTGLDGNSFASPQYPRPYLPNQDCVRVLEAPPGHAVVVAFKYFFQVEKSFEPRFVSSDAIRCPNDFLELRDGQYGFSPLIGRFCGMSVPEGEYRANSGHVWIRFHSDEVLEYKGFFASYRFVPAVKAQGRTKDECHFAIRNTLDGYIDTREWVMHQGNLTGVTDCVWEIVVPSHLLISLTFESFSLPEPNDCSTNLLDVYDGSSYEKPLKRFCGVSAVPVFSTRNVLLLRLYTADEGVRGGVGVRVLFSSFLRHKNCTLLGLGSCGDENCIPHSLFCNGRPNCLYGNDESECRPVRGALWNLVTASYFPLILLVIIVAFVVLILIAWACDICSTLPARCPSRGRSPPAIQPLSALSKP